MGATTARRFDGESREGEIDHPAFAGEAVDLRTAFVTTPGTGLERRTRFRRILFDLVAVAIGQIGRQLARRRTRLALGALSDEQLRDIGLTRSDVERQLRRGPRD